MLTDRIREQLAALDGVTEKRIVGGVGFTWRGNLLCGVQRDELLVRVPADALVGEDGAHPMTMGGRPSKGFLLVPGSALDATSMSKWLDRAIEHVATLPAK